MLASWLISISFATVTLVVIQRRYLPHHTSGGQDIALATVAGVNHKEEERVTRDARQE